MRKIGRAPRWLTVRRTVGILTLFIGAVGYFALKQETDPGVYIYHHKLLVDALGYCWLASSFCVKALMVTEKKYVAVNIAALLLFSIFVASAGLWTAPIVHYQRPPVFEALVALFLVGWPLIDIVDASLLQEPT